MKFVLSGDVSSSTLANAVAGQPLFVILCQDTTGGHAFVPPPNLKWNTATVQDPNYCTAEGFIFDGTTAFNLSPPTFVVRGSVAGLANNGLTVQINAGAQLSIPSGASSFLFQTAFTTGQTYSVTIATQPSGQACTLSNNSGVIAGADVSNVSITCAAGFSVGGMVEGIPSVAQGQLGQIEIPITLVAGVQTELLNVSLAQTQFVFNTLLANGQSFTVSSSTEIFQAGPITVSCPGINNLTGTIANANVTNIVLSCSVTGI